MSVRETVVDALVRTLDVENRMLDSQRNRVIAALVKGLRENVLTKDDFVNAVCKEYDERRL